MSFFDQQNHFFKDALNSYQQIKAWGKNTTYSS